jgi:hypothetical protein
VTRARLGDGDCDIALVTGLRFVALARPPRESGSTVSRTVPTLFGAAALPDPVNPIRQSYVLLRLAVVAVVAALVAVSSPGRPRPARSPWHWSWPASTRCAAGSAAAASSAATASSPSRAATTCPRTGARRCSASSSATVARACV